MTVHRTDIIKAQFFEQGATRRQAAGEFLCFACGDMQRFGELACQSPQNIPDRSEEHTSELQSLMRISYAVFCWKKKQHNNTKQITHNTTTQTSTLTLYTET